MTFGQLRCRLAKSLDGDFIAEDECIADDTVLVLALDRPLQHPDHVVQLAQRNVAVLLELAARAHGQVLEVGHEAAQLVAHFVVRAQLVLSIVHHNARPQQIDATEGVLDGRVARVQGHGHVQVHRLVGTSHFRWLVMLWLLVVVSVVLLLWLLVLMLVDLDRGWWTLWWWW